MADSTEKVEDPEETGDGRGPDEDEVAAADIEETGDSDEITDREEVSLGERGTMYRGRSGVLAFGLHRLTGMAIFAFLLIHIVDVASVAWGRDAYNTIHQLYESWLFRIFEIGLLGALLIHALNGLRIIVIDFWDEGADYQKELTIAVVVSFFALFIPGATIMTYYLFQGH